MLLNIKKSKKGLESFLALDIGTHSVKAAIFLKNKREAEVLGYGKSFQDANSMKSALIVDTTAVTDKVDQAIGFAVDQAKSFFNEVELPKKVIVGIAGELVKGVPIIVNVDRDDPEREISAEELAKLIRKVKEHTFQSMVEEIAEEIGFPSSQIEEIDTYIDSIYLDDVRIKNPIGLKGSTLKCKVFSTFAPKVHYDSIAKVVKDLGLELAKVIVEPYALSLSLDDVRSEKGGGVFIDVGGGTTDIAVVENGEVKGTKMFAIGGRVFTKRLEKELGVAYDAAEKRKIDYSNGRLEPYLQKQIKSYVAQDIKVWITGVELSLEEFEEEVTEFPPNIFLCGGGALLPEIMEALLTFPWVEHFNFKKNPKIQFLFPNKITRVEDATKKAKDAEDVTPMALVKMSLEF